jgi:hypothetical protein
MGGREGKENLQRTLTSFDLLPFLARRVLRRQPMRQRGPRGSAWTGCTKEKEERKEGGPSRK